MGQEMNILETLKINLVKISNKKHKTKTAFITQALADRTTHLNNINSLNGHSKTILSKLSTFDFSIHLPLFMNANDICILY